MSQRRLWATAVAVLLVTLVPGSQAIAMSPEINGRIVFVRPDPAIDDVTAYTIKPNGSDERQLYDGVGELPNWSPDGRQVAILSPCPDGSGNCAALIVNAATGSFRALGMPDPSLFTACTVWTPDGSHLACGGSSTDDTNPTLSGIYVIRSSDGGGLTRLTAGDDSPGQFSPDGHRLVFERSMSPDGDAALFVTTADGRRVRQITPTGLLEEGSPGSWSPRGDRILFAMRSAPDQRFSIWSVGADGSGLRQLPIEPRCGGAFTDPASVGCFGPAWSPDGTQIAFSRAIPGVGTFLDIVNSDGSGFRQVGTGISEYPRWGVAPPRFGR